MNGAPKPHLLARAAAVLVHGDDSPVAAGMGRGHLPAHFPDIGPRLAPCVCGAGRHAHQGAEHTGRNPATGCHRYRHDIADQFAHEALVAAAATLSDDLIAYEAQYGHRSTFTLTDGQWGVGPSDVGTCRKQIEYRERPPADYVPIPIDVSAAAVGTAVHDMTLRVRKALYPWRLYGLRVTLPGFDRHGTLDDYDPITATVNDDKTKGTYGWDKVGERGPDEDAWDQGHLYGMALLEAGYPVRTVRITVINRTNGRSEVFERPYDPDTAKRAADGLLNTLTMLDLGEPLPRDRSGPSTDALCRDWCPAVRHCWGLDAAEPLGRSGESYVALGDPADLEAAEHFAAALVAARDAETAAKQAKEEAKALLEGLPPGEYGDYLAVEYPGKRTDDWKAQAERLVGVLRLPPDMQPPIDDDLLTPPKSRGRGYMTWKRHRKAVRDRKAAEKANPPAVSSDSGGPTQEDPA